MPSKRSPTQRTQEGRRGRQLSALLGGTNAGRLISASHRTAAETSSPASPIPTASSGWTPELILTGFARVATNIAPPGLRVPQACTLSAIYLRLGTAPTGASLIFVVKNGATTLATLTVTAGSTTTSSTGLSAALALGDIITFNVTQIGSTIAGADMAAQLVAA